VQCIFGFFPVINDQSWQGCHHHLLSSAYLVKDLWYAWFFWLMKSESGYLFEENSPE
jgi:hypothetical protein